MQPGDVWDGEFQLPWQAIFLYGDAAWRFEEASLLWFDSRAPGISAIPKRLSLNAL